MEGSGNASRDRTDVVSLRNVVCFYIVREWSRGEYMCALSYTLAVTVVLAHIAWTVICKNRRE